MECTITRCHSLSRLRGFFWTEWILRLIFILVKPKNGRKNWRNWEKSFLTVSWPKNWSGVFLLFFWTQTIQNPAVKGWKMYAANSQWKGIKWSVNSLPAGINYSMTNKLFDAEIKNLSDYIVSYDDSNIF